MLKESPQPQTPDSEDTTCYPYTSFFQHMD